MPGEKGEDGTMVFETLSEEGLGGVVGCQGKRARMAQWCEMILTWNVRVSKEILIIYCLAGYNPPVSR